MENSEYYRPTTKMFSLICQQPSLLQMMSRFGIPLGVEDKTVDEICSEHDVDTTTFLAVANYILFGRAPETGTGLIPAAYINKSDIGSGNLELISIGG